MIVWPVLRARLVSLLPTLPGFAGVVVYDGQPLTGDVPAEYVTVGYVPNEDFAGNFERLPHLSGVGNVESGSVRLEIVCRSGDTDIAALASRAFALVQALDDYVTANRSLGVLTAGGSADIAVDPAPAQTSAGAVQRLTVTVLYVANCT